MKNKISKKIYSVLKLLVASAILFSVAASVSGAEALARVRLNQSVQREKILKVYFEAQDSSDESIYNLTTDNVSLTAEAKTLDISDISKFTQSQEGIAYIFLIDVSTSVSKKDFEEVQESLINWIDNMNEKSKAGIITFGEKVKIVSDFSDDKEALKKEIENLQCTEKSTQLYAGIMKAAEMLSVEDDSLPDRRASVLITDGNNSIVSSYTEDEVSNKLKDMHIPFYALGMPPTSADSAQALTNLTALIRLSGGETYHMRSDTILTVFDDVYTHIHSAYVITAEIPPSMADNQTRYIQLSVSVDGRKMDDGMDLKLESFEGKEDDEDSEDEDETEGISLVIIICAAVIIVCIVFWIVILIRRSTRKRKINKGFNPSQKTFEQFEKKDVVPPSTLSESKTDVIPKPKTFPEEENIYKSDGKTESLFGKRTERVAHTGEATVAIRRTKPKTSWNLEIVQKNASNSIVSSRSVKFSGELQVGRLLDKSIETNIIIDDETVSRLQFALKSSDDGIAIINKSKVNPTEVNGGEIGDEYIPLPNNATIVIGRTTLIMKYWKEGRSM